MMRFNSEQAAAIASGYIILQEGKSESEDSPRDVLTNIQKARYMPTCLGARTKERRRSMRPGTDNDSESGFATE